MQERRVIAIEIKITLKITQKFLVFEKVNYF